MKNENAKIIYEVYILGLVLIAISLNTEESSNAIPVMGNKQFDVLENISKSTTIANLEATDSDGDKLTFQLKSDIDLTINPTTGEIKTTTNSIFDYETETTLTFLVGVKDV